MAWPEESSLMYAHDDDTVPTEPVREKLIAFGKTHGFTSSKVIARALNIPDGTINNILYDKRWVTIKGKTKREIEHAIRHFDPRTSDETLVKGTAFRSHLMASMTRADLTTKELSKIMEVPWPTVRKWINNPPNNLRAGYIRPLLIKLQDYEKERAARLVSIDTYNARPVHKRGGYAVPSRREL